MRRIVLAAVAVVSLALALAAPATAKSSSQAGAENSQAAEHRRIAAYWTPARMANARPRDIVVPLGTKPNQSAKPTKPGGSGSPSANSLGATWSFGGDVVSTTGKVFFTMGGVNYVCSGSFVRTSTGKTVVSTAGHCAHEGDGSGASGYATNFLFRPGWTGSTTAPRYTAVAGEIHATTNWQARGAAHGAYPDDAAFVQVTGSGAANVPAPVVSFTSGTADRQVYAFGYPAAQRYKGNTLTYCSGLTDYQYDGDNTLSIGCNMTGGSSGGPWFESFNGSSGVQMSVNSYGYSGVTRMFGPVFDTQEKAAYDAAAS